MYSGTTLTKYSGRVIGTHQKFDRIARRRLKTLLPSGAPFPPIRMILQFEGKNGPDGIKRKSPSHDEPWHFYDPFDEKDTKLIKVINEHYKKLVRELRLGNMERSAFEAAWLAHALVDGLTPAHQYPYEQRLVELSGGLAVESRVSVKKKLVMHGNSRREKLRNNWLAWGPRGLRTAHGLFEMGIAAIVAPLSFGDTLLTDEETKTAHEIGPVEVFKRTAREIAVLGMYETYVNHGWTPRLAWQVRHKMAPSMVKVVTLVWYLAAIEAQKKRGRNADNSRKAKKQAV